MKWRPTCLMFLLDCLLGLRTGTPLPTSEGQTDGPRVSRQTFAPSPLPASLGGVLPVRFSHPSAPQARIIPPGAPRRPRFRLHQGNRARRAAQGRQTSRAPTTTTARWPLAGCWPGPRETHTPAPTPAQRTSHPRSEHHRQSKQDKQAGGGQREEVTPERLPRRRRPPRAAAAASRQQQSTTQRAISPPQEGVWIANRISSPSKGERAGSAGTVPHSHSRILAFRPECNPPARATVASRRRLRLQTLLPAPPVQDGGRLDNTVGARAGEHGGADPAELDAHSEHFSPPYDGETTLKASPPAKRSPALVTRCARPRIGTRPTHCAPHPPQGEGLRTEKLLERAGRWAQQPAQVASTFRDSPLGSRSRRPEARRRDSEGSKTKNQYWAHWPPVTPSGPVGTDQLVRPRRSWGSMRSEAGGLPRNPSPT